MKRIPDIFTSCSLHILAMGLMLLDHMWATLFLQHGWMTCIGRIAFPIFAFMIVEGYFHTHDFKKYALRMLGFAVLSEIPFNLIYGSSVIYPFHQNVLWTFLIALLCIRLLEKMRAKYSTPVYVVLCFPVIAAAYLIGLLSMADYHGGGVLVVLLFYFLRERTLLNLLLQVLFFVFIFPDMIGGYYYPITIFGHYFELMQEGLSILALIPIWLYKGRQGYHKKWFQYFCYGFYPGHLLILYIVWKLYLAALGY